MHVLPLAYDSPATGGAFARDGHCSTAVNVTENPSNR